MDSTSAREDYLPLSAAAALVFEQARRAIPPVEFPDHRSDALNIVAGALSRLVTVYAYDGARGEYVAVALDPAKGRFIDGGSAFRGGDRPGATITSLWVRRIDLGRALLLIRQVGLPFVLAVKLGRLDAPRSRGS